MPAVGKSETRDHYLSRCVPMVLKEGGTKSNAHAVAKCSGMFKSKYGRRKKGGKRKIRRSSRVENVFCPTGPGGGKDPTCKAGGSATGSLSEAVQQKMIERLKVIFHGPGRAAAISEVLSAAKYPEYLKGILSESPGVEEIEAVVAWGTRRGRIWEAA